MVPVVDAVGGGGGCGYKHSGECGVGLTMSKPNNISRVYESDTVTAILG